MSLHTLFFDNLSTRHYLAAGGYDSKSKVLRLISDGDTDAIYDAARGYADGLRELFAGLDRAEAAECAVYVFAQASAVATNAGLDDWEAKRIKEGYYQSIEKTSEVDGLAELCREFIIDFTYAVRRRKDHVDYSPIIQNILTFINENLENKITVSDLAREFYCSESYISHRFRQEVGQSVSEYILQRKIVLAKMMIRQQKPIAQVAQEIGFSSQSHFSRAFRKVTGKTPLQWKKEAGRTV